MNEYFVYILASRKNGTLYIGVTNDLLKRVHGHKNNLVKGFSQKYNVHTLVYYEMHNSIHTAIAREKQMKKWNRQWKINLIEKSNLDWEDLYYNLTSQMDSRLRGNDSEGKNDIMQR
jgi:putative endonuclease